MPQTRELVIYPTSRAVRKRVQSELKIDALLPKILTIGEFENRAVVVNNRTFIDQDTRVQLLNKASEFSNFKELQIKREFFAFLKNSSFLFGFFDELSVELVDIKDLHLSDTYASYHEHIEILSTLLKRYKQLLKENNYVDKITLPSLYTLNLAYIKSFDKIWLHLEGYLNNFEFKLLREISEICPLYIYISTNSFNKKMIAKFLELGIKLDLNYDYIIDLSKCSIKSKSKSSQNNTNFTTSSFQTAIMQVAFVKKRIYDYIKLGIEAENIAVVLPNSSFSKMIDLFDDKNNYNFAMGTSYTKSEIYQNLLAKYEYFSLKEQDSKHRLQRLNIDIKELELEQQNWSKKLSSNELKEKFNTFVKQNDDEQSEIYFEELHLFSKLFPSLNHQPFHKLLHLFLNRLSVKSIDDVKGGKVTVMEVLETRGVSYDGIIVVDFNEGVVPKSSHKDLFLSSEIRHFSSLPTTNDRENLQKYYYKRMFDNAKFVSISYIEDEKSQPSRFLDELNIPKNSDEFSDLSSILFTKNMKLRHYQEHNLEIEYDFSKTKLSATSLKSYFDCKRMYYFKYIQKLENFEIPKDDNSDRVIGLLLHEALKNAYTKKSSYFDEKELFFKLEEYLHLKSNYQDNLRFLVDVWMQRLKPFIKNEIKRANDGYEVLYIEKSFDLKIDDFTITGQIDRVDKKDDFLEVIDYKSGSIPKDSQKAIKSTSNFQLQIYHLLASQKNREVKQSYYYDLASGNMICDEYFDEKLDILYKNLEELKGKSHNFLMTEDIKKCTFCPYIKICNRML